MSLLISTRPTPGPSGPRRRNRARHVTLLVVVTVAVLVIAAVGVALVRDHDDPARPHASAAQASTARSAAHAFLADWVNPDGRVVRRDQGGDTVSEGQGYALLLAVAAGDDAAFTRVWTWTARHLQQPNGSLAWRWNNGGIVDDQPASDADLDVTRALLLAADTWPTDAHANSWTVAAKRIAAATLATSTIVTQPGRLLVGGPWALGSAGQPARIAPSYIVAGEADALADATGAAGWRAVAQGSAALDRAVVGDGRLSPDWTSLAVPDIAVSAVRPAAAPDGSEQVAYGLDAPRLLIRLATSCDRDDRSLAASAGATSARLNAPAIRSLDGRALVSWTHPLSDIAAAAVESARDDVGARDRGLAAAAAQQRRSPTYYGAAWVALGTVLLTTSVLDSCATGTA